MSLRDPPISTSTALVSQMCATTPDYSCRWCGPNLEPRSCEASSLPAGPSPQSRFSMLWVCLCSDHLAGDYPHLSRSVSGCQRCVPIFREAAGTHRTLQVSVRLGDAGGALGREVQTPPLPLSQHDSPSPTQRPQACWLLTEDVGRDQELCLLWSRWAGCALVRM